MTRLKLNAHTVVVVGTTATIGKRQMTMSMNNDILEYMTEQYPDILESWEESVLQDGNGSDYLQGIVEAYEHIINKFSLYEGT